MAIVLGLLVLVSAYGVYNVVVDRADNSLMDSKDDSKDTADDIINDRSTDDTSWRCEDCLIEKDKVIQPS